MFSKTKYFAIALSLFVLPMPGATSAGNTKNTTGPTVKLQYKQGTDHGNSIDAFTYFIPTISPSLVKSATSRNNQQQVRIISHKKKVSGDTTKVFCEFEMLGKGWHKSLFDPKAMIDRNLINGDEPITNLLDNIKFEGKGYGKMMINCITVNGKDVVTEVEVRFDARGAKSPVTIELYSVKQVRGRYKYENRFDRITARINSLKFKKTDSTPRMALSVASVSNSSSGEGILEAIKGAIANIFINPITIDKTGNDTMMAFGMALINRAKTFTFPKASNFMR